MPANIINFLSSEYNISKDKAEDIWSRAKKIFKGDKDKEPTGEDYALVTSIAKKIASKTKEELDEDAVMSSGSFPQLKNVGVKKKRVFTK